MTSTICWAYFKLIQANIPFYTPRKHKKTRRFLMYSEVYKLKIRLKCDNQEMFLNISQKSNRSRNVPKAPFAFFFKMNVNSKQFNNDFWCIFFIERD